MRSLLLALLATACFAQDYKTWQSWGGTSDNIHYSALKQINKSNVSKLKVAWTYESKDEFPGSEIQCQPIFVNGVVYGTTPKLRVVALDAATGKEIWSFDGLKGRRPTHRNRGLSYWTDGKEARLLFGLEYELLSLDAKTGKLDPNFGNAGRVDMREAFDRPKDDVSLTVPTPGAIYKDLIILGSSVPESLPSTPGDIRAYDVRTGKLRWTFHTIPRPGEPGYETWPKDAWKHTGGANAWAGLIADVKGGRVFVSTGSAAFDFYGADRHGDNLYANSIVALDAETGKYIWHYQAIKHDVWDLDFPQAPMLVQLRRDGKLIDAVAQAGKDGYLYVLDRATGKSLFPLKEVDVPQSSVEGELLSTKQTIPLKPEPFSKQEFTEDNVTNRTPEARAAVLARLKNLDYGKRFTPPSLRGTVEYPAFSGGAEWGGGAYDPETRMVYINANEIPWVIRLVPPTRTGVTAPSGRIYRSRCASCHGADMKGAPPEYPSLVDLSARMTKEQLMNIIRKGAGRMPAFATIGEDAIDAVSDFVLTKAERTATIEQPVKKAAVELKYTMDGYNKFEDPEGFPASRPPWGTLNAIKLDTGEYAFKVPLGEYPELVAKGMKDTGSENHGGGIVTAGGLFFIAATPYDKKVRAFDKLTGKLLWEYEMPFAGNATLATYQWKGKQYLVVPNGGGRGRKSGGNYIAFALP